MELGSQGAERFSTVSETVQVTGVPCAREKGKSGLPIPGASRLSHDSRDLLAKGPYVTAQTTEGYPAEVPLDRLPCLSTGFPDCAGLCGLVLCGAQQPSSCTGN